MPRPTCATHHSRLPGVTHDPFLRPIGTLIAAVALLWAMLGGMAFESAAPGEPLAAIGLFILGVLLATAGKRPSHSYRR